MSVALPRKLPFESVRTFQGLVHMFQELKMLLQPLLDECSSKSIGNES